MILVYRVESNRASNRTGPLFDSIYRTGIPCSTRSNRVEPSRTELCSVRLAISVDRPINGVIPEQNRVQMTKLPGASNREHKVWALQHRRSPYEAWRIVYTFEKDTEVFETDFEM